MKIDGSTTLITGGASGLGAGTARMLVEQGGSVGIVDLASSAGAELAAELGAAALFVPADVTDASAIEIAVADVVRHFRRVDVCVNAAGVNSTARVMSRSGQLHSLDLFRRTVEINLIGTFDVLRHVTAAMVRNSPTATGERGLIVNVASVAALEGQRGQAAYSASKGGVVAMTLPLARDLAEYGIRVLTICPGVMDTAMLASVEEDRRDAIRDLNVFPKRLGAPADFAHLVAAMIENEMLNGEVIRLDAATRL